MACGRRDRVGAPGLLQQGRKGGNLVVPFDQRGTTPEPADGVCVEFTPKRVRIGGRVAMTFGLKSSSTKQQRLLVDVTHFIKARGVSARKVFKLGRLTLGPREPIDLKTTFSLAVHTTRVPPPGRHDVDVIVNGCAVRAGSFEVSKP